MTERKSKGMRRGISLLLVLCLLSGVSLSGLATALERSNPVNVQTLRADPFAMMADSDAQFLQESAPLLEDLQRQLELRYREDVDASTDVVRPDQGLTLPGDEIATPVTDMMEQIGRQISESDVLAYVRNGEGALTERLSGEEEDRFRTDQLEHLYETSRVDRFIVKYQGPSPSLKIEELVPVAQHSAVLDRVAIVADEEPESGSSTMLEGDLAQVGDIMSDFSSIGKSLEESKRPVSTLELVVLPEKVNPAEFAEELYEAGLGDVIEYIQPDFVLSYANLGLTVTDVESGQSIGSVTEEDSAGTVQEDPANTVDSNIDNNTDPTGESPENPGSLLPEGDDDIEEETTTDGVGPQIEEPAGEGEQEEFPEVLEELELLENTDPRPVLVALIDTGVDTGHTDLAGRLVAGWNFVDGNDVVYNPNQPMIAAHGTHIAGIIVDNSGEEVQILPLQVFGEHGAYTSDILAAIATAEAAGAQVVNCSFGSGSYNRALEEAIAASDMLFVTAAGNARSDLEISPVYPAAFELDNLISVASLNEDGGFSYYSNYSTALVDIAARGRDVMSALPGGERGLQSGTSQAAGAVSAAAARVLSEAELEEPLEAWELKLRLTEAGDMLEHLQNKAVNGRRLNVGRAIQGDVQDTIKSIDCVDDFDVHGYQPTPEESWELFNQAGGVMQVAAGEYHSLTLMSDGTVWTWGYNNYGQLGDGTTTRRSSPVQVAGLTDVTQISAGYYHNMALKADGTAWAWGYNGKGQLGDGTLTGRSSPVQVKGLTNISQIAAGDSHSLAIKTDGSVWAWGSNGYGQLGDGTYTACRSPIQLMGLTGMTMTRIAARYYHSLALNADGTVWAWGNNAYGQLGDGTTTNRNHPGQVTGLTNVVRIAVGDTHNLAVKADGTIWAWGRNYYGQLGDGTTTNRNSPVQLAGLTDATQIAAAYTHSLAVKTDGTVWAWGRNNYGQLGDGITTDRGNPMQVIGLTSVSQVVAGYTHNLAVKADGTLLVWGTNAYGQFGDGTAIYRCSPVQMIGVTNTRQIAAGDSHSLMVNTEGAVWAWGYNDRGQLGDDTITNQSEPIQVAGLTDMIQIAAGFSYSLGVSINGTVWAWGYNSSGQLGDGTGTERQSPVQVTRLTDATQVAAGYNHSLAVKTNGTVWSWGRNYDCQLGDGTTTDRHRPVQVMGLIDMTQVAAGQQHSLASKSDGTVWAWGDNLYGQLGDGTTIDRNSPVQVTGLTDVIQITAGYNHNMAIKSDGTVWAWGYNDRGKLGIGITGIQSSPVQVVGLTGVTQVAAGHNHSLALKTDGTVWAWGDNSSGQLGDGTTTNRSTPVQLAGLSDVVKIVAGKTHSLAIKADGTVWAWGDDAYGQLGLGRTIEAYTPIQVQPALFGPGETQVASLSFINSQYTVSIPISGTGTTTVEAVAYDEQETPVSTATITYNIPSTAGVSIDFATGVVTVLPTASPGNVTVTATCGTLTDTTTLVLTAGGPLLSSLNISVISGKRYDVAITAEQMMELDNATFTFTYDPAAFDLLSCLIPYTVTGTGEITITLDREIPAGSGWSGIANVIRLRAKATTTTTVEAAIQSGGSSAPTS